MGLGRGLERKLIFGLLACGACGEGAPEVETSTSALSDAPMSTTRPRPMYLQVPDEHLSVSGAVDTMVGRPRRGPYLYAGPGDPPLPIFLNRNGGTYSPGPDDSRQNTSIVPNGVSTVSAFSGSNNQWQTVVDCLTEMFAPYNAVIVEVEPPNGEYIEAVIGGFPQELGLPNGVGGVAPIDSSRCRIIPNAVVYAFAGVYGNQMRDVCETAAQEIAHALSLDHELYCPDPMTYLSGCGDKTFRDHDAQCGEFSARACNCGRPSQNSVEVLTEKLGLFNGTPPPPPPNDPVPPTVAITSPANGANFPENSTITVTVDATDNLAIAATELVWQFTNATFPCPYTGSGGAVTCTRSGNTSTWQIRVGQGNRTFYARARDTAGNQVDTPPRTISLGANQPPPVNDTTPPVATITAPAAGAMLPANSTIQVSANVSDNEGLASVDLVWTFTGDSFPCPYTGQTVSCTASGGVYTWNISVGVGTRRFQVHAVDLAGNVTDTPEQDITLTTQPTTPPPNPTGPDLVAEDNDNPSQAFPTRCGTAIDLVVTAGDDDWFTYDVAPGTLVSIGITAAAGSVIALELFDPSLTALADTPDVLANGGSVAAAATGNAVLAHISTSASNLPYRLSAVCSTPEDPPPVTPPTEDPPAENPPTLDPPPGNGQPYKALDDRGDLRGGCGCSTHSENGTSPWSVAGLLLVLALGRRRP